MTLRLNGSSSGYTEIDAPAVAGSNTLILPGGNGSANQRLVTDGSGTLSWSSDVMLAAGSAASPSLYFSGDTNTGMWSPGADDLAWSTGGTERMRVNSAGTVLIGKTTTALNTAGTTIAAAGELSIARNGDVASFNRITTDGQIVRFFQDATEEGSISVSGTTVSYNGAHLSRWSQLPNIDPYDKTDRPEILRGTVMSNLDEMCDWTCPESGECQDNEQLNKTKISDVEGDKNVAGIFQSWDDDDDTWVNDFYLAMTGDFVIRVAAGTTVERGDLLMSAGDGTAMPQDDDIIRSKTIAKVTSTNVSCTYPDGSYCIPCVLMAC